MQRILLAIGGAAVLCAVCNLPAATAPLRSGLPVDEVVLMTAIGNACFSPSLATFLSYRAITAPTMFGVELERLSRSMDAAIKDVSARGDRDAAVLGELSATVSRKLEALRRAGSATDTSTTTDTGKRRGRPASKRQAGAQARRSGPDRYLDQPGVEIALRRAASSDAAELVLQPIIAAGSGAAGGFEVHFHVQPEDGEPVDIRRLPRALDRSRPAAFERLAVVSAREAARKRPGDINDKMPLHVAISERAAA